MSAAWAAPGVRCVCINGNWSTPLPIPTRVPMLNEVLTVAAVKVCADGLVFLYFEEIAAFQSCDGYSGFVSFTVDHFKPLVTVTQAQDVALFAPLLDVKKPVEAS